MNNKITSVSPRSSIDFGNNWINSSIEGVQDSQIGKSQQPDMDDDGGDGDIVTMPNPDGNGIIAGVTTAGADIMDMSQNNNKDCGELDEIDDMDEDQVIEAFDTIVSENNDGVELAVIEKENMFHGDRNDDVFGEIEIETKGHDGICESGDENEEQILSDDDDDAMVIAGIGETIGDLQDTHNLDGLSGDIVEVETVGMELDNPNIKEDEFVVMHEEEDIDDEDDENDENEEEYNSADSDSYYPYKYAVKKVTSIYLEDPDAEKYQTES